MEREELKTIGSYVMTSLAEGGSLYVLNNDQRLELRELLKKWLAELAKEPITASMPDSWGDVRASSKVR